MKTETKIIQLHPQPADRREELFSLLAKLYVQSIFREVDEEMRQAQALKNAA